MRQSIVVLLLAVLLALPSQAQIVDMRPMPRPAIVGGWRAGRIDDAARAAARAAVRAIGRRNTRLDAINSVETQVVAGMNYRLRLTLSDHTRWEAVVWRRLDVACRTFCTSVSETTA